MIMSRKKRYIQLRPEQKVALEKAYKTGHSHDYRKRCHCILLSSQNWTVKQLSDFFKISQLSVYKWFNRYESEGIQGLQIRPGRGRKRKLNIDNKDHVDAVKVGLTKENRSIKQLKEDLESQLGTSIGDTTLRDFLKVLVTDTDDSDSVSSPARTQGRWVKK